MTPASDISGEVEQIAKGLTKAQREALTEEVVRDGEKLRLRWNWPVSAACRCALQRKGFWESGMNNQAFTPLGLAVRAHLLGEKAGG